MCIFHKWPKYSLPWVSEQCGRCGLKRYDVTSSGWTLTQYAYNDSEQNKMKALLIGLFDLALCALFAVFCLILFWCANDVIRALT